MKLYNNPHRDDWPQLCERPQLQLGFLESSVNNILARVKQSGDYALKELTGKFDNVDLKELTVTPDEIHYAAALVKPALKAAIETAASNIKKFHQAQLPPVIKVETMPGVTCWRKSVPIEKVGIYIPGGTAPLFSTVLMLAIPATLAGCNNIVLVTPPDKQGQIHPAILYAAQLTAIKKIYKVGGAQAIAALAYGTETIPKVNKIFGPGNQYVTKAKQLVNQQGTAIDLPAGPSEVLIWADDSAVPEFVAADLLSQAEHGTDSQVMLVANNSLLAEKVFNEVDRQVTQLPRKEIAGLALQNSRALIFDNDDEALDFINSYAPEHLIINKGQADKLAEKIRNAGSVFIGNYSPEAAGDYASGTNHTLPTSGYAATYGGVSVESFLKHITFQEITEEGIRQVGPVVEAMAHAEELIAHKNAISIRLKHLQNQ
ncbi:MAG: histidinol dehydrogenase [Cyclobacteriaceae bacterium]|nr:histidinol dehydrogenase [Cyclobacteriaceae bacterium]